MEIQWLGHSASRIAAEGRTILIDPYFTGNPACPENVEKTLGRVDHILVTHGHNDHVGDTVRLAKQHGAQVTCMYELAEWMEGQGVENCVGISTGGTAHADGLSFTMVHARHGTGYYSGSGDAVYLGIANGFVVKAGPWSVYHAGDTDVFSDMALIQRLHAPNVGLIPIGGHFTMDASAAALACNEFLDLDVVIPMHFGTFPVLAEGADAFKEMVTRGRVEIMEPGRTLTL